MLHKCANSTCSNRLRRLSEGKLFQVESEDFSGITGERSSHRPRRRVEHFWLCTDCCGRWTLSFEKGRGMVVVPLPVTRKTAAANVAVANLDNGEILAPASTQTRRQ